MMEPTQAAKPCDECDVHPVLTYQTIPGMPERIIGEIIVWHSRRCSRYNGQDAPAAANTAYLAQNIRGGAA